MEFQLDPNDMATSSSLGVIYEEIPDPPNCTQCPAYVAVKHDSEDMKLHGNEACHGVPVQSTTSS